MIIICVYWFELSTQVMQCGPWASCLVVQSWYWKFHECLTGSYKISGSSILKLSNLSHKGRQINLYFINKEFSQICFYFKHESKRWQIVINDSIKMNSAKAILKLYMHSWRLIVQNLVHWKTWFVLQVEQQQLRI